jgi:diadenosine tetraphosphatase ApaH/serine/threonine PP2A family protein phosphatase
MRTLLISDIHSNLEAFHAVVEAAGPVDMLWCLGDVVGYGPDPNACLELLRSLPHLCIAGNHDWATLGKLSLHDFNSDARLANRWNRLQLTPDNLAYLESLTETRVEGLFTLAHGSPRDPIWEYILHALTAQANLAHFDTPYCLVGHTHTPVVFRSLGSQEGRQRCELQTALLNRPLELGPERLIINPGSVGQPRDGDPRASFAILDTEGLTLEHRRVDYAWHKTQAKMLEYGIPEPLAVRLGFGW